jgi:uncharacterized protein
MTPATTEPRIVGAVVELWRYPVKSMQGEPLGTATLTTTGIPGDRAWGVTDVATGRVLSAKTVPQLLDASATTTEGGVQIHLPDGTTLTPHDRDCDHVLSDWLGRPVTLHPAGAATSYEMTFDPPDDQAELVEIPTPAGTLFDLAGVHLLTTSSLATAAAAHPVGAWAPRRFRPNLVIDTDPATGYPEDEWVDHHLTIGAIELRVLKRTVRCAIPLRAQPAAHGQSALARDVTMYRTLARHHDNHLGAYADATRPGTVTPGDPVALHGSGA